MKTFNEFINKCPFCDGFKTGSIKLIDTIDDVNIFIPLNPVTDGHLLFVPIEHVVDFTDNPEVTARVARVAGEYVKKQKYECNLITSKGVNATQSVFHLHFHVVPRIKGDTLKLPWYDQQKGK